MYLQLCILHVHQHPVIIYLLRQPKIKLQLSDSCTVHRKYQNLICQFCDVRFTGESS